MAVRSGLVQSADLERVAMRPEPPGEVCSDPQTRTTPDPECPAGTVSLEAGQTMQTWGAEAVSTPALPKKTDKRL